jgi:SAM-dependent methyltransferase
MNPPATELTEALRGVTPGRALDLACGAGRHAIWLRDQGWQVTAVNLAVEEIPGVTFIQADLEQHEFAIEPQAWDLIVCWLYWQEDLLPSIAAGLRPGGMVALAGKTEGRFATSLMQYRRSFAGWRELASEEDAYKVFFIARAYPHVHAVRCRNPVAQADRLHVFE